MFNFLIRPQADYNLKFVALYVLLAIYLFSPWGIWLLCKAKFEKNHMRTLVLTVLTFAFSLFFLVSLKNPVGLHWFLLFVPYMYLLFMYLDEQALKKLFKYNYIFALIHGLILLGIMLLPISMFKTNNQYSSIVYASKPDQICKVLDAYTDDELFALGYTPAAVVSYDCKRDLHMLFNTSKFGRMDDRLLNIKSLNHKDITLFNYHPIEQSNFANVCESLQVKVFEVEGASFYLATCQNFSYPHYKAAYLDVLQQSIYNVPTWLPQGQCYFDDMYYP